MQRGHRARNLEFRCTHTLEGLQAESRRLPCRGKHGHWRPAPVKHATDHQAHFRGLPAPMATALAAECKGAWMPLVSKLWGPQVDEAELGVMPQEWICFRGSLTRCGYSPH